MLNLATCVTSVVCNYGRVVTAGTSSLLCHEKMDNLSKFYCTQGEYYVPTNIIRALDLSCSSSNNSISVYSLLILILLEGVCTTPILCYIQWRSKQR